MAKEKGHMVDPNKMLAGSFNSATAAGRVSFGDPAYPNPKNTQTVKTRGTGAATRGTKSSTKLG